MKDSLSKSIFEHERVASDTGSIKQSLANCFTYSVGKDTITGTDRDRFFAAAYMVRNRMIDALLQNGDKYMLLADYASYIACQKKVETVYQDQEQWIRKAILNIANMGKFSSDRTIMQYAKQIWDAQPVAISDQAELVAPSI